MNEIEIGTAIKSAAGWEMVLECLQRQDQFIDYLGEIAGEKKFKEEVAKVRDHWNFFYGKIFYYLATYTPQRELRNMEEAVSQSNDMLQKLLTEAINNGWTNRSAETGA